MDKEYCIQRLRNWVRIKGYSINTLSVYESYVNKIFDHFDDPQQASLLQIQDFAISYSNDHSRRNVCVLLRWLFDKVYHQPIDWRDLPYPKRPVHIQPIYTLEELQQLLNHIHNPKQKAILALIIDCGLRINESCDILLSDCDSKQGHMIIRNAKGKKDRIVNPSPFVWQLIRNYWNKWEIKPKKYLFEGQQPEQPYTPTSIRSFVKAHCKQAKVPYKGIHAIRRFTGTWWVEHEVPLTVAAKKLGHSSTRPLEKHYVIHSANYMANVPSPLKAK